MKAGTDYCFRFNLKNPDEPQDPSPVRVTAQTVTTLTSPARTVTLDREEVDVPTAENMQPIRVVGRIGQNDLIDKAKIQQLDPNPGMSCAPEDVALTRRSH